MNFSDLKHTIIFGGTGAGKTKLAGQVMARLNHLETKPYAIYLLAHDFQQYQTPFMEISFIKKYVYETGKQLLEAMKANTRYDVVVIVDQVDHSWFDDMVGFHKFLGRKIVNNQRYRFILTATDPDNVATLDPLLKTPRYTHELLDIQFVAKYAAATIDLQMGYIANAGEWWRELDYGVVGWGSKG
ncbi:MAG TPA: DEAD/DEAH box helicase family protein [Anaerolineae bacterium]|nr:DEAD/DEAH box helicase family protein [Anaerolineae bacterium]